VILVLMVATFTLRRRRVGAPAFQWPGARRVFAPWLIAAGVVALLAVLALGNLMPVDLLLPRGHHLRLVPHGLGEATYPTEGDKEDEAFGVFARVWVGLSFAAMCLWHLIALRDAPAVDPARVADARTGAASPSAPAASPGSQRRLVFAIWLLMLIWSGVSFSLVDRSPLCRAPFPWPVALMPIVFFGLGGLFQKRSPFMAPWLAEIIDSRFGAGATERFLVALKPMLLFAASSVVGAISVARACSRGGGDLPFPALFFAAGGIGFALMHLAMRLRKIEGV
jgi:hypothetical protein